MELYGLQRYYQCQLVDQIQRSVASVALNIAEGAGEFSPAEKARFYRIALRSATESASSAQILHRLELIGFEVYQEIYLVLTNIAKMLTKLIASMTRRQNIPRKSGIGIGKGHKGMDD